MLKKIFNKLAGGDARTEANLMILFIFLLTGLFFVLGASTLATAIKQKLWTSYLWSAVLFIFAIMQSYSLKHLILSKLEENRIKNKLKTKNYPDEEIGAEQISKLLDEENEKTK